MEIFVYSENKKKFVLYVDTQKIDKQIEVKLNNIAFLLNPFYIRGFTQVVDIYLCICFVFIKEYSEIKIELWNGYNNFFFFI